MSKKAIPFLLILLIIFEFSCSTIGNTKKIDEGIIEFNIDYPVLAQDDIMREFFPSKMEFVFKNNSYRNNIVAGMGLFSTSFINSKKDNSITQTVKLLNSKYVSTLKPEDMTNDPDFREMDIKFIEGEKEIAGYTCKAAEITVYGDSTWTYRAYYTEDIQIESPNKHTPFEEINGVLMDYQLIKYGIHMHFTATEVFPKEISEPIEKIDEDYKFVSSEQLGLELKNIFAKLK